MVATPRSEKARLPPSSNKRPGLRSAHRKQKFVRVMWRLHQAHHLLTMLGAVAEDCVIPTPCELVMNTIWCVLKTGGCQRLLPVALGWRSIPPAVSCDGTMGLSATMQLWMFMVAVWFKKIPLP